MINNDFDYRFFTNFPVFQFFTQTYQKDVRIAGENVNLDNL